jgi:hypothetical protein
MDALMAVAMVAIAGQMQVVLAQSTPQTALEYDLRTATRHALNVVLPVQAVAEASVKPPVFGSTVDVGVPSSTPDGDTRWDALIELKWWYDPTNQVDDSLKDAVKMATYRSLAVARTAYLVAGGSPTTWEKRIGYGYYTRLWETHEHDLVELIDARSPYAADQFKPPKQFPAEAPRRIATTDIANVPIQVVSGSPWMLRCSRVEPGHNGELHHFNV